MIFLKNKVSLPTAEKLLIHWPRHLPRALEQPKGVLTFLNSEQRAEIPLPRNHSASAIPGKFVPFPYPSVPFPPFSKFLSGYEQSFLSKTVHFL